MQGKLVVYKFLPPKINIFAPNFSNTLSFYLWSVDDALSWRRHSLVILVRLVPLERIFSFQGLAISLAISWLSLSGSQFFSHVFFVLYFCPARAREFTWFACRSAKLCLQIYRNYPLPNGPNLISGGSKDGCHRFTEKPLRRPYLPRLIPDSHVPFVHDDPVSLPDTTKLTLPCSQQDHFY